MLAKVVRPIQAGNEGGMLMPGQIVDATEWKHRAHLFRADKIRPLNEQELAEYREQQRRERSAAESQRDTKPRKGAA